MTTQPGRVQRMRATYVNEFGNRTNVGNRVSWELVGNLAGTIRRNGWLEITSSGSGWVRASFGNTTDSVPVTAQIIDSLIVVGPDSLGIGDTACYYVDVLLDNGEIIKPSEYIGPQEITWTTSDPSVAVVEQDRVDLCPPR